MERKIFIRGGVKMTFDATGKMVLYDKKIHGLSDEHKAKISTTLAGRKPSKASRKKMTEGKIKAWKKDPRRISDEKKLYIVRLRLNENKTPTEIGELLGIDRKMISKILLAEGISSHKLPDVTIDKVVNLYKDGNGITAIAKEMLLSKSTIEKIIQRSGVKRHKSSNK